MNMSFMVFDFVVLPMWLPLWPFYVACFHIGIIHSTICVNLISLVLLYAFGGVTCFIFCSIKSAFLVSIIVIPSSHNIIAFLCCCNVDHFIHVIAILRYDYKPTSKHNS